VSPNAHLLQTAEQLAELLDEEFAALKAQQLASFEALQPQKDPLIRALSQVTTPFENELEWQNFLEKVRVCRDAHRRNELLLQRQLDVIRSALRTLQGPDPLNSVEIYDRMGRMGGLTSGRGRGLA
jgi:flagellar biosynthesis/type III secretory pathway chaperone